MPSTQEFHWQTLARLSNGRVYHTLSEVGGQVYMLGGCDAAGRPCASLELYSPEVPHKSISRVLSSVFLKTYSVKRV